MCDSKADGGFRCKTHVEAARAKIDKKIHEGTLAMISEDKRPNIDTWKPTKEEENLVSNFVKLDKDWKSETLRIQGISAEIKRKTKTLKRLYAKGDTAGFLYHTDPEYKGSSESVKKQKIDNLNKIRNSAGIDDVVEQRISNFLSSDFDKWETASEGATKAFGEAYVKARFNVCYYMNDEYVQGYVSFRETPEGEKLQRKMQSTVVAGQLLNKSEIKKLQNQIDTTKDPQKRKELEASLHKKNYVRNAYGTVNQIDHYTKNPKPLGDGESRTIGMGDFATTIITEKEARARVSKAHREGIINGISPGAYLANKGLYVEGSAGLEKQLKRSRGSANQYFEDTVRAKGMYL